MKEEIKKVKLSGLVHAEWNPRDAAEMDWKNPALMELGASIKANGLLHPIGVWIDAAGGREVVIYGNRRVEAAKSVGIEELTAIIYRGITEAEAKIKTREENDNRLGVSAMKDSELIRKMMKDGLSQQEIAERTGKSEATICRRVKLLDLCADVRVLINVESVDTKGLELIAAQPTAVQIKMAKHLKNRCGWQARIPFADVKEALNEQTAEICEDHWMFGGCGGAERLRKCRGCALCTGNQPTLFDESDEDVGDRGASRCLDLGCFKAMRGAAKKDIVAAALEGIESRVAPVEEHYEWELSRLSARKPSKKNPCAHWLFNESTGTVKIMFGPDPAVVESERKRQAEEIEARRREGEAQLEVFKSVIAKVNVIFEGEDEMEILRNRLVELWIGKSQMEILGDLFVGLRANADAIDRDVEDAEERMKILFGEVNTEKIADVVCELWGNRIIEICEDFGRYSGDIEVVWIARNLGRGFSYEEIKMIEDSVNG